MRALCYGHAFQSVGLTKADGIMKKIQYVQIRDQNIKRPAPKTFSGISVSLSTEQ